MTIHQDAVINNNSDCDRESAYRVEDEWENDYMDRFDAHDQIVNHKNMVPTVLDDSVASLLRQSVPANGHSITKNHHRKLVSRIDGSKSDFHIIQST